MKLSGWCSGPEGSRPMCGTCVSRGLVCECERCESLTLVGDSGQRDDARTGRMTSEPDRNAPTLQPGSHRPTRSTEQRG